MAPTPSTLISGETLANLLPRYIGYRRRRLSRGALIGVIVAIVIAVIILAFLSVLFRKRRVRRSRINMHQNMQQTAAAPGGWTHSFPNHHHAHHHAQNPIGLNTPAGGWAQPGIYQPPPYQPDPVYQQGGYK